MKSLKKYYLLMLLIIIIAPMFVYTINQSLNQERVKTIEYRIEKTDDSDFGYDPKTKNYQATSVEAINDFFAIDLFETNNYNSYFMGFSQEGIEQCSTIYSLHSNEPYPLNEDGSNLEEMEMCMIELPIGVDQINIVDQVSVPLKFSKTLIDAPKYQYLINGDGTLSYDINIYEERFSINTTYYKYVSQYYDYYSFEDQDKIQQIDISDDFFLNLNYFLVRNNVQIYIVYAIFMLIAFWTAKRKGARVSPSLTIFILFILINLMLLFTTYYLPLSEQIKDIQQVTLVYNILYIPMYIRIFVNNWK